MHLRRIAASGLASMRDTQSASNIRLHVSNYNQRGGGGSPFFLPNRNGWDEPALGACVSASDGRAVARTNRWEERRVAWLF